jgi:hypothetical protein
LARYQLLPILTDAISSTILLIAAFRSLEIGNQFLDIPLLHRRHHATLAQSPFSFFRFGRQYMAFEAFVSLDLAAAGYPESLRCGPVRLNLRHFVLL